ncbi:hypothetical protein CBR_g50294 [Chara braunii]|uniref:Uncharacterized protein n=1 Tax=Chara braunii TaxID=69332 RepID=A0A388K5B6_CHABU|nr:hypothetical protein CBR_g50294 [Chara braunii]|eukprot:GBG65252.1 hypothetical protein CBR_g50294 [Chara braunii]
MTLGFGLPTIASIVDSPMLQPDSWRTAGTTIACGLEDNPGPHHSHGTGRKPTWRLWRGSDDVTCCDSC